MGLASVGRFLSEPQWTTIVFTARSQEKIEKTLQILAETISKERISSTVKGFVLDLLDTESISNFVSTLKEAIGSTDVFINN